MKLTRKELDYIKKLAGATFINVPYDTRFKGETKPLAEGDKLALSYFHAVVNLLNYNGGLAPDFLANFTQDTELPDFDPDTE